MSQLSFASLQACAQELGLSVVGVTEPDTLVDEVTRLTAWQTAGYAGDMRYMNRSPELLTTPQRLFESVRSIVVVGAFYDRGPRHVLLPGYGRIARYAWGRDYHKVLPDRLRQLVSRVEREVGCSIRHRIFSDAVPLLERAVAGKAGLGFVGKNTMMIMPRAGSFMFLGEVLWELEVTNLPREADVPSQGTAKPLRHGKSRCGSCVRCLESCPTGAFASEYVLDARRCISYLTIEKRGTLSVQERAWIGEWLFGCDICQEVCPFNSVSLKIGRKADIDEFHQHHGFGPMLSLAEILTIRTDEAFGRRFGGTPLTRAKREGLVRNAAIVAANTGVESLLPALHDVAVGDPSPVSRRHALWSYVLLGSREGGIARKRAEALLEHGSVDPDQGVREEARLCREL